MQQIALFIAVGCAAALTHLTVVATAVELLGVKPLSANILGFALAFFVSFAGHSRWTFPVSADRLMEARARFLLIACGNFLLTQSAYAEVLPLISPHYYLAALALILLVVAAITFTLSKLWAFTHPQS